MLELIALGLIALGGATGSAIYFPARKEWNETFRRAAKTAGTNLGIGGRKNEQSSLGAPQSKKEIEQMFTAGWTEEFNGGSAVAVIDKNRHVIVKSWSAIKETYDSGQQERWHWQCSCGETDSHVVKQTATYHAIRHVTLWQGRDEKGVKENNWHKTAKGISR